jgi:uncharacterized protein YbjT (DUF2867 family)
MNVLLTGASGFIGRHIAVALHREGHSVKPVSRRHGVDFGQMQSAADWRSVLAGVDAVINCAGIIAEQGRRKFDVVHHRAPSALFRACAQFGVGRAIQISALGADQRAFTPYQLSKRGADDVLRALDLDWFVLRPSLVFGLDGYSAKLFLRMAAWPRIPTIGNGQQKIQPVHVDDVVSAVMHCLGERNARQTLDLVGQYPITYLEWLQILRRAQGLRACANFACPASVATVLAQFAPPFFPVLNPDTLRMLEAGNWADCGPFRKLLGRMPLAYSSYLSVEPACGGGAQ